MSCSSSHVTEQNLQKASIIWHGGEMKLFYICEFPIYDHPVVSCPSRFSPHCSFTFRLRGVLQCLSKVFFSGYETLCCYQKPLETDGSPFFELKPSWSWGLGRNEIEQGPSGSTLPVLLDATKLFHYILKHKFLQSLLRK